MRLFTSEENDIIEKLVGLKQNAQPGSLADLQVARLLRKELNFFALKWSIESNEVTIFIPKKDSENNEYNDQLYFKIANYIYFLEELEELGFIKFQNIPSDIEEKYTILYDRNKYSYEHESETFWEDIKIPQKDGTNIIGKGLISLKGWHTFKTDFAKDLQRCGLSIVYPLPLAEDYVKNDFRTLEQRQFEKQMNTALDSAKSGRKAANWGIGATIIALFALVASIITLIITICNYNKPITLDEENLNRIESAINSNHLSELVKTTTNDTLVIRQVQITSKSNK